MRNARARLARHPRLLGAGSIILVFALWQVGLTLLPSPVVPTPTDIVEALLKTPRSFTNHFITTGQEALLGLGLALLFAVPLAVISLASRTVEDNVFRTTVVLNSVPLLVLAPLLTVWIGTGVGPRIVVAAMASYFGILVNSLIGFKSVSGERMELFHVVGADSLQTFRYLRFPASLPFIFSALKVAVVGSVLGAVIGEWVGANAGLGVVLYFALFQFQVAQMWAAMLLCTLMALIGFLGVSLLERLVIPWHESMRPRGSTALAAVER
jgi:NitT/TauT family transport system permease protein